MFPFFKVATTALPVIDELDSFNDSASDVEVPLFEDPKKGFFC